MMNDIGRQPNNGRKTNDLECTKIQNETASKVYTILYGTQTKQSVSNIAADLLSIKSQIYKYGGVSTGTKTNK